MAQVLSSRAARLLQALSIAALLGVAGCSGEVVTAPGGEPEPTNPTEPTEPAEADVQVGSGSGAFQELGAGAEIAVVAGGQGGYHIWISARCEDCGPEVTLRYGVEDAQTGALLSFDGLESSAQLMEAGGWREVVGLTGFLSGYTSDEYLGRRVRLWATIVDAETGEELDAEAEATVTSVEYYDGF